MSRSRPLSPLFHVVALCAVALFNTAVVRSAVMQAAPAMAMEHCADMAGMRPPPVSSPGKPAKADAKSACAFCAAAAHAPVTTDVVELSIPSAVVWRPLTMWRASGPRGPPPVTPTARGPPAFPMI